MLIYLHELKLKLFVSELFNIKYILKKYQIIYDYTIRIPYYYEDKHEQVLNSKYYMKF